MHKKILEIKGMHCISCELILSKGLKKIKWVELHQINHKKWLVEISYKNDADLEKVIDIITSHNFEVKSDNWNDSTDKTQEILIKIVIFMWVISIFSLLSLFDIYRFIPDTTQLNYFWAFVIWIIASLSTCLAVTWWLIAGFSRAIQTWSKFSAHLKVQWLFQYGRLVWFFIFWWLLGIIGQFFKFSLTATWFITFFVWILLVYLWLQIVWILPSITKLWVHLPKSFASKIQKISDPKFSPIVGALTFFLPCGFTQTVQLVAIASWDWLTAWLIMLFFALGTTPVLFSVWLWSGYFQWKKFPALNIAIWAFVFLFWMITISNSYNLIEPIISKTQTYNTESNTENLEFIEKSYGHNWWSTEPWTIQLDSWKNYKLTFTPSRNGYWCMATLTIPRLSRDIHYVRKGVPITYEIINAKKGVYNIVCSSMWMQQWTIIVN